MNLNRSTKLSIVEQLAGRTEGPIDLDQIVAVIFYRDRSYSTTVWCGPGDDIERLFLRSPERLDQITLDQLDALDWLVPSDLTVYLAPGPEWGFDNSDLVLLVPEVPDQLLHSTMRLVRG